MHPLYRLATMLFAVVAIVVVALAGASDTAIITIGSIVGINCGLSVARNSRN